MMDIRTYYLAAACCILTLSPFAPALADADELVGRKNPIGVASQPVGGEF